MSEQAWSRLAVAAMVLLAAQIALLGALWAVPLPPAELPRRASPVRLADAAPAPAEGADPETLRAGRKALDAILADRLTREATARGRDPAALLPPPEVRRAAVDAPDGEARLLAAYDAAFAALGVSYQ
jgi:hypothetical protein